MRCVEVLLTSVLLLVPLGSAPARGGEDISEDLELFINDEVRYIITDDERREWEGLETNAERLEFAKRFWAKRDPDPSTALNEYRQEHHRRIHAANQLFRGEGKKGWLTDRGRIYIIFGPPDEARERPAGAGSVGQITWTYRAPDNPYLGPNTRIVFEETSQGRYNLASDVNWSPEAAYFSSTLGRTTRDDEIQHAKTAEDLKTAPMGMREPEIFARLAGGELPPGVERLSVEVSYFPVGQSQIYVPVRFARTWKTTGPGETLRVRVDEAEEGGERLHTVDVVLAPEGSDTRSLGFMLDPGTYRLSLACENDQGKVVAACSETVEVPDLAGGKLATSSVLLARSVNTRESGTVDMQSVQDGLVLGNFALEAPLGNAVPKGAADPYLIYLVSGAKPKPSGELDLTYSYEIKREGELVRGFNERPATRPFVGHPLPVTDLEPSEYTLEMALTDRVSKQELKQSVSFRIE